MECRRFWGANLTNHCSVWGEGMSKVNLVVRGWDLVRFSIGVEDQGSPRLFLGCSGITSFVGDPGLLTERVGEAGAEGMLPATGRVPGQAAPQKLSSVCRQRRVALWGR